LELFQLSPGFEPSHFVDNYDFTLIQNGGTFVDIGGSHGPIPIPIDRQHPNMTFVIQDLPEVIQSGRESHPIDLKDRITFQLHDYYKPQPVKDADIYYFRWIFHNVSDKYAVEILRNLKPALEKGARVVISEFCVPPPGALHVEQERKLR
jgi:hypothetical protein